MNKKRRIQMSKTPKRLTNSEREIMQVLWKSEKPLTASGIIAASPNKEWKTLQYIC